MHLAGLRICGHIPHGLIDRLALEPLTQQPEPFDVGNPFKRGIDRVLGLRGLLGAHRRAFLGFGHDEHIAEDRRNARIPQKSLLMSDSNVAGRPQSFFGTVVRVVSERAADALQLNRRDETVAVIGDDVPILGGSEPSRQFQALRPKTNGIRREAASADEVFPDEFRDLSKVAPRRDAGTVALVMLSCWRVLKW